MENSSILKIVDTKQKYAVKTASFGSRNSLINSKKAISDLGYYSMTLPSYDHSTSSHSLPEKNIHKDLSVDYHYTVVYNGNGLLPNANKGSIRSISNLSASKKSLHGRMSPDADDTLNESFSFVSLPSGNLVNNRSVNNSRPNSVYYAPLTESNLRKLNYLNRNIYLPSGNVSTITIKKPENNGAYREFDQSSIVTISCYGNDDSSSSYLNYNEHSQVTDVDALTDTLDDELTSFRNRIDKNETQEIKRSYAPYIPNKDVPEPVTDFRTEINMRPKYDANQQEPELIDQVHPFELDDEHKMFILKQLSDLAHQRVQERELLSKKSNNILKAF